MIVSSPTAPSRGHASVYPSLDALLAAVRSCRACEAHLPLGPRPVLHAGETARILVVGQAPGVRVHRTGVPWDDPSGERLRVWMGVDRGVFYDESRIAIIPMGYCYPGRGNGGDMPPRRECASLWLDQLLARLPRIELTLLIGQYAQRRQGLAGVRSAIHAAAPPVAAQSALVQASSLVRAATRPGVAHTNPRAG